MADSKNIRDGRDRSKVDINDPSEIKKVQQKFPEVAQEQIMNAIRKAGPVRENIYDFLKKAKA